MRNIILCILLILSCFSLFADEGFEKELTVGLYENPPSLFTDRNNKPQGLYVDLLSEIANKEKWKLTYISGTWSQLFDKLKKGELDMLPEIAYSTERDAYLDYVTEPILLKWGVVYLQKDSLIEIITDLEGKTIAAMKDDIHTINFTNLLDRFDISYSLKDVASYEEALKCVSDRKADAGIVNNLYGATHEERFGVQRSTIIFNPTKNSIGFKEGLHGDVINTIDGYLGRWKQDKSSIYYKIYNRWFVLNEVTEIIIPRWLLIGFAIALGGAVFFFFWISLLRYQVKIQTKELRESAENIQRLNAGLEDRVNERTAELKKANKSLRKVNKELTETLEREKQLKGLLPICSGCKKIRDSKGYWKQVEQYIEEHSEAKFSHGLCEHCAEELYGGEDWYKEMKEEEVQQKSGLM